MLLAAWAIGRLGTDLRLGRLGDVARFGLGCLVGAIPMGLLGVLTLLSLGGTVLSESVRVAGDELSDAISVYLKKVHNLVVVLKC